MAPEDRWTQLGTDYGHHVKHILDVVINIINKIDKDIVPFILEVNRIFKTAQNWLFLALECPGKITAKRIRPGNDWSSQGFKC